MTKMKYIKACPFLRDLGDSFLCVNDDDVVDVLIDPLIDIDWSEYLPPVASEIPDQETCLFTIDIKDDGKLFCISRNMYLKMDKRFILWKDIRDSIFLLNLDEAQIPQNSEIDFCSTCLYKVLLASSPTFQQRLNVNEKIKLGCSYILNKANELINNLSKVSGSLVQETKDNDLEKISSDTFTFNWMQWLTSDPIFDDEFIATAINWFQRFDEWGAQVSKIADANSDEEKVRIVEESTQFAADLKQLSYDIVMKILFYSANEENDLYKITERVFTIATVQFEDFTFICNQFLDNVKEN